MALKQHLGFDTDIAWSSDDRNDNSVERISDTVSMLKNRQGPEFGTTYLPLSLCMSKPSMNVSLRTVDP